MGGSLDLRILARRRWHHADAQLDKIIAPRLGIAFNLADLPAVMNGRETSDWDTWRQATAAHRVLSEAECVRADRIAAHPEAPPKALPDAGLMPPWLRR